MRLDHDKSSSNITNTFVSAARSMIESLLHQDTSSTSEHNITTIATTDDDYFSSHEKHRHDINATSITSTVVIRVTPRDDHLISWCVLWTGFFMASVFAAWQVHREHRIFKARLSATNDIENGGADAVSSADRTRCTFRRILLLGMLARLITMPVMIWSDPLWLQFVGDTLPEMIFATAWTLMVTFFVQLVGSVTGIVTSADASIVIQATAYIVYTCLVVLELFNSVASVLLYALLCCIYAALLGSIAYFCPKLMTLLKPSLASCGRALVIRLYLCTFVCIVVFTGHMVVFAQVVIFSPQKVYWWINYGLLELIPAVIFLFLMNPTSNNRSEPNNRSERNSPSIPTSTTEESWKKVGVYGGGGSGSGMRRVDSVGSASASSNNNNSNNNRRGQAAVGAAASSETTSLMKGSPSYGSAAATD
mmetsp:Transcript_8974/g.11939  ORF Transcript_8974/g.11939 Transcript_8974/m.11939 type:complete len:421 (-) Transcript_8974:256-1518(-)